MSHVASQAHQRHDLFNLICLPLIVAVNLRTIHSFFIAESSADTLDADWNIQIAALNFYIYVDSMWILVDPASVSAVKTILLHHGVVFFGWLLVPHKVVEFRPIATCLLSVEINTVFMIARKYQYFQQYPSLTSFLRYGFYVTWIPLRLVIFPYCCYLGFIEVLRFHALYGSFYNIATMGWMLLLFITGLNVKWSYDLFGSGRRSVEKVNN